MTKDQTPDTTDQRRYDRKAPSSVVPVIDALTGERMGQIGNLSPEGLMLIAQNFIEQGALFQIEFTLTDRDQQEHTFDVGAFCLWCSAAKSRDTFWAGFEIMDISEQDASTLRGVVVQL